MKHCEYQTPTTAAVGLAHIQAEERLGEERDGNVTHGLLSLRQRLRKGERPVRVLHILNVDALSCRRASWEIAAYHAMFDGSR